MPTVIIIDGIKIEIYTDDHPPPHFHVKAGKMRAKFDIATGQLLKRGAWTTGRCARCGDGWISMAIC